jgi:membrane protease YdiL (CAAX protease family)
MDMNTSIEPPMAAGSAGARGTLVRSPLVRIVLGVVIVGLATALAQASVHLLRDSLPLALYYLLYLAVSLVVAYLAYAAYVKYIEHRHAVELTLGRAAPETVDGIAIGAGLVAAVAGIFWLSGSYDISSGEAGIALLAALANDASGAFVEEVLLRAILFRLSEEFAGTAVALVISAVLFGALHAGTPSTIPVAMGAGLLLAAAYLLTRNIWLAVGIHFGWDYAQDAIFGLVRDAESLLHVDVSGPSLLTGGATGIEASLLAFLLILAASALLLVRARRRHQFRAPSWRQAHHDVSAVPPAPST